MGLSGTSIDVGGSLVTDRTGHGEVEGVLPRLPYADMLPEPSLVPARCDARVLLVAFTTASDLARHLPPQIVPSDPHRGYLKVLRTRTRFLGEPPLPLTLSQSIVASVGVRVTRADVASGGPERDFHCLSWHSRSWALGRGTAPGSRVRQGEIEMSWTFPASGSFDRENASGHIALDIARFNGMAVAFRGALSTPLPPGDEPPFTGYFTIERASRDAAGTTSEARVTEVEFTSVTEGPPVFGTGTVSFRALPDDQPPDRALLDDLDDAEVTSCSLRDVSWTRMLPRAGNGAEGWPK